MACMPQVYSSQYEKSLPKDFCSIKVITGTHHTGPLRKPTKESKTQESSVSSFFGCSLLLDFLLPLSPFFDILNFLFKGIKQHKMYVTHSHTLIRQLLNIGQGRMVCLHKSFNTFDMSKFCFQVLSWNSFLS